MILLTEISAIYTVKFINDRSLQKNVQLKYYTVNPNNSDLQEKLKKLLRVFENKCKWEWRANYRVLNGRRHPAIDRRLLWDL